MEGVDIRKPVATLGHIRGRGPRLALGGVVGDDGFRMSTPSKLFELNQFNTNPRSYGRQGGGGEAVGAEAVVVADEEGGDAEAGVGGW